MKRFLTLFTMILLLGVSAQAQKVRTISGNITTNTTLHNDSMYMLDGYVYVKNNATLTIEEGTIIKGVSNTKATLIITRNGKIHAQGTKEMPIVFTSDKPIGERAPSDWGGIVIMGKALVNGSDCSTCPGKDVAAAEAGTQRAIEGDLDNPSGDGLYGGNDDNHNSGVLSYVRIEFAGTVISPGNEINGLTMGGVGRATKIDHIQTSFVNDDGFEWFGGNVDAKYLISFRNIDDDYDTDFGYTGRVQYGIAFRDSMLDDKGSGPTTNGFESDNDGAGTTATPNTMPVFSNITVVGPLARGKALDYTNSFQNGIRIRRNSGLSLFNSVVMGFPTGIFVDGDRSVNKFLTDSLILRNNVVSGWTTRAINAPAASLTAVEAKFGLDGNRTIQSMNNILTDPFNYTNPDFTVVAGGSAASGASFTTAKISDTFFTRTTHIGAVGTAAQDWTKGWANFDPQTTDYSKPMVNSIRKTPGNIASVNVFPNPAANILNVQFTVKNNDVISTSIYSVDGKCIQTQAARTMPAGNHTLNLDVNNLTNGLYILKISTTKGQENIRFNVVK